MDYVVVDDMKVYDACWNGCLLGLWLDYGRCTTLLVGPAVGGQSTSNNVIICYGNGVSWGDVGTIFG